MYDMWALQHLVLLSSSLFEAQNRIIILGPDFLLSQVLTPTVLIFFSSPLSGNPVDGVQIGAWNWQFLVDMCQWQAVQE